MIAEEIRATPKRLAWTVRRGLCSPRTADAEAALDTRTGGDHGARLA